MNTVKAQKTDDNNKPPLYRVVSDSEVIIQPRGATSNKLDDVYHLSPASPAKSLDNTEPLEDVFFASPNTVQDISETRSSHTSSSSSDGEFLKVMTYETFVADFCCVLFLRATCCACHTWLHSSQQVAQQKSENRTLLYFCATCCGKAER